MGKHVVKKEKIPGWISYMWQRIRNHKNFIAFISGPTGSGKSWASLSIAEQVDSNFHAGRIVFSGKELMEVINYGKLKKGSAIIFEEAGVGISNRDWHSQTNKMINFLVQTFRHRNFILIMNSPYMDFVDKATRKLFHAEFQMDGINFEKKLSYIKPQVIQYSGRYQKWYYKWLKIYDGESVVPIVRWGVRAPSENLMKEYEKKKLAFTTRLNAEILKSFSDTEKSNKKSCLCAKCDYKWETSKEQAPRCPKCTSNKTELVSRGVES